MEDGNTDDAYPRCNDYDCEQFWGNWTECSTFCSNGTRTRSFALPPGDADAEAFDLEVCRSTKMLFYDEDYPVSGGKQGASCDTVAVVEDGSTENAYPRCSNFMCEQFWGNWTECSTFCSNGTRSRSYVVPLHDAEAQAFDAEVCRGAKVDHYNDEYPASGGDQHATCDTVAVAEEGSTANAYPRCHDYDCEHFWSNWTGCSTFCSNGTRTRSFVVPFDDVDAQAFDSEVCRAATVPQYDVPYPISGGVHKATCDTVAAVEVGSADGAYPRCHAFDCEQFWGNWTECSSFCSNGTRSRSFAVPLDDPDALAFDQEVCRAAVVQHYGGDYPPNGGVLIATCETVSIVEVGNADAAYPRCSEYECASWWGPWTECDTFCSNGHRQRTFDVPAEAAAVAFNAEVCAANGFPRDGGVTNSTCEEVAVELGLPLSQAYPRCGAYDCMSFFTNWTPCSTFCSNGTRRRTFDVDFTLNALAYNEEVCQGAFGRAQYPFPPNEGVEEKSCEAVSVLSGDSGGGGGGGDVLDDAYPRCNDFACDDFFTDWTPCSSFCSGGTRSRTFVVPERTESSDAPAYVSQMCRGAKVPGYSTDTYPENGEVQTATCETVALVENGVVDDDAYPRCQQFSCDEFFGAWGDCTAFCPDDNGGQGGNMTRHAVPVPTSDNATAAQFYLEVCSLKNGYPDYGEAQVTQCGQVPVANGGGYPQCAAEREARLAQTASAQAAEQEQQAQFGITGAAVAAVIGLVVIVGLIVWSRRRRLRAEKSVRTTAVGQMCLRVTNGNVQRSVRMARDIKRLQRQFSSLPLATLWFALDKGRRKAAVATQLLNRAAELQLPTGRGATQVEALELAEWELDRDRLPRLQQILLDEVPSRAVFREVLTGASFDSSGDPPFLHLAVATRWTSEEDQRWAVSQLARALPPAFVSLAYCPRPCPRRAFEALNVLQLALNRLCGPKVLGAILAATGGEVLAEQCAGTSLPQLAGIYAHDAAALGAIVETILDRRLKARIRHAWWEQDAHGGGKAGTAGFVPPPIKTRELKTLLTTHAESLLSIAGAAGSAGTPVAREVDYSGQPDQASNTQDAWMLDEGRVDGKQEDESAEPTATRSPAAARSVAMNQVLPLGATIGGITAVSRMRRRQSDVRRNPWPQTFQLGFLRPALRVLRLMKRWRPQPAD